MLEKHPNIKAIFCNGGKSYKNLQSCWERIINLPVFLLPSTSPLHTVSFEKKLEDWKKILDFLK
jgi:G:T/U-mismatch repair DNA glycosylase